MKQLPKVDRQRQIAHEQFLTSVVHPRLLGDDRHFPAFVYSIEAPGGETYYGSSFTPGIRFSNHIRDLSKSKHLNKMMQSSWDSCGGIGFTFTILSEHSDRCSAFKAELDLINSSNNLMNAPRNKPTWNRIATPAEIAHEVEMQILRMKEDPF